MRAGLVGLGQPGEHALGVGQQRAHHAADRVVGAGGVVGQRQGAVVGRALGEALVDLAHREREQRQRAGLPAQRVGDLANQIKRGGLSVAAG